MNSDPFGKVVNLASRTAKFVADTGLCETYPDDGGLFAEAAAAGDAIAAAYEAGDFAHAMRLIIEIADRANPYVENNAPWELRKDPDNATKLQEVCSVALNLFRQLAIYLAPVLPDLADKAGDLFGEKITSWEQSQSPLVGQPVAKFKHMMQRVDPKKLAAMIAESREQAAAEMLRAGSTNNAPTAGAAGQDRWQDGGAALAAEPIAAELSFDDFMKIDLRVARIVAADEVPEARKLIRLTLSLGGDQQRQVFAGIKSAYKVEELVGRLVVMVANLAPRQMKFGLSEGMVIASGPGGEEIYLLSPDSGAVPGQRVH